MKKTRQQYDHDYKRRIVAKYLPGPPCEREDSKRAPLIPRTTGSHYYRTKQSGMRHAQLPIPSHSGEKGLESKTRLCISNLWTQALDANEGLGYPSGGAVLTQIKDAGVLKPE